ncbi:hypothetical protein NX059_004379 [Plenodomus lindquistii]|nr:hypothetical protein NX059_004379 [Plenodomus lindquistii]
MITWKLDPLREEEEGPAAVDVFSTYTSKDGTGNRDANGAGGLALERILSADSAVGGMHIDRGPAVVDFSSSYYPAASTSMAQPLFTPAQHQHQHLANEPELEHIYLDLDDDGDEHEGTTLIETSDLTTKTGIMQGIKQVDLEISDDDDDGETSDLEPADKDPDFLPGGLKRKRTIRLIIRSRAFL